MLEKLKMHNPKFVIKFDTGVWMFLCQDGWCMDCEKKRICSYYQYSCDNRYRLVLCEECGPDGIVSMPFLYIIDKIGEKTNVKRKLICCECYADKIRKKTLHKCRYDT
jgi:hypothetical protein